MGGQQNLQINVKTTPKNKFSKNLVLPQSTVIQKRLRAKDKEFQLYASNMKTLNLKFGEENCDS